MLLSQPDFMSILVLDKHEFRLHLIAPNKSDGFKLRHNARERFARQ